MQHHHAHLPHPTHIANAHPMHQQTAAVPPPSQPPPRITINLGPPQQQQQPPPPPPQQQQSHHINTVVNGTTLTLQQPHHHHQQQQQQHQLQAQNPNYLPPLPNRVTHHHHLRQQSQQQNHLIQTQQRGNPQAVHTTQMQKIRQQHQLVNNSNNNKANGNNNQQHHHQHNQQPQPQQQQHPQQQHPQQQQQPPQQQQQQQQHISHQSQTQQQNQRHAHHPSSQNHAPSMKQQQQQQQQHPVHNIQPISVIQQPAPSQQQQPHTSSTNTTTPASKQQQNYAGGNAVIYSNNNKNNNNTNTITNKSDNDTFAATVVVPKTILQNPNRIRNKQQHNVIVITPSDTAADPAGGGGGAAMPAAAGSTNGLNSINAKTSTSSTIITTANIITKTNTETTTSNTTMTISTSNTPVVSAKLAAAATTTILSRNPNDPTENSRIETDSQEDKENDAPSTSLDDCNESYGDGENTTPSNVEPSSSSAFASKEKTPMCLVNELARFNKITHQYRLTSEKGPAHCKRFTVTLKLGDEEYSAEGYKIKKAQHMAAAEALEKTKYDHPVPKLTRRLEEGGTSRSTITPTVELNALAMKLGQPTYYLFDPRQQPHPDAVLPPPPGPDLMYGPPRPHIGPHANTSLRPQLPPLPPPPPQHLLEVNPYIRRQPGQYQRFNYYHRGPGGYLHQNKFIRYPLIPPVLGHNGAAGAIPPHHHLHHPHSGYNPPPPPPPVAPCKITLIVGKQKFVGIGRTLQSAKHDAASHALQVIRTQAADQLNEILNRSMEESDSKSPISLVHEIGIKRNMTVHFKVLREEGPAHMKNFITACIAGNIVTEGCGNGKKISKKRAAEKMLEELKKLPPLSPMKSPIKRFKMKSSATKLVAVSGTFGGERKKRVGGGEVGATSIPDKSDGDSTKEDNVNPISKLIILLQTRKESDPVYELISKNGNETTRRREFIMEVRAAGNVARGRGNNMKMAKSNAAHNLLEILKNESQTAEEIISQEPAAAQQTLELADSKNASVTGSTVNMKGGDANGLSLSPKASYSTTNGQVPGILILRQHKKNNPSKNSLKHATIVAPSSSISTTAITAEDDTMLTPSTQTNSIESLNTVSTTLSTSSTATGTEEITKAATNLKSFSKSAKALYSALTIPNNSQTSDASSSADSENSTTATATTNTNSCSSSGRMKKQLLYLAEVLGFEVEFSDYPKGNHNEFLTIVTLSTTPEQICHGTGATSEESQNDAAKNALKILSELDINKVKSK